ncbi:hemin uptake protein HemP [Rhodoferax mekongensis]|uniref:Hemin uptake protein HemP n=1 Tax=Rhodoferax mekongensis TaxID=3068341 RepID=A0ABZ0AX75_9BURK|nr:MULTISPECIES: hemin uptake protein HemP [unclassified Rhodoferax]MDT7515269.1 hemin uptake protein HemP [Rhodoferax sp. TBRC 17199]WNO03905.1 hemin uptake protein HemP [Rhodoferax sp. TBRC 17307]
MAHSTQSPLRTLAPMRELQTHTAGLASAPGLATVPVVQASALLGTRQSVEIEYKGQRYRLQTTKAGKLILTK